MNLLSIYSFIHQKSLHLLLMVYAITSVYLLTYCNGVGPEADSITHFLIAKYSFEYPHLFLDHWGKPVFTLMAAPFASFGFIGIKAFNLILTGLNTYLIVKLCQQLQLKFPVLAGLFYLLFPLTLSTSYSGLTEPLFATFLLLHLCFVINKKYVFAAILLSFMPFIRTEGLILLCIFGTVELFQKRYYNLFWLLTGHVVYAFLGAWHYASLWWVFEKIPYASMDSPYGSGQWFHFFDKMTYVMGIPLMALFWLGLLAIVWQFKSLKKSSTTLLVASAYFGAFFIAHTIFWTFGIFNSMGLKRVFAAVTPLMAIVALYGFSRLNPFNKKRVKWALQCIVLVLILLFPFSSNPAANEFSASVQLTPKQESAKQLQLPSEYKRILFKDPYLYLQFEINPYDNDAHMLLYMESLNRLKIGDVIVWDDWHANWEKGNQMIKELQLDKKFKFTLYQDLSPYYKIYVVQ